MDDTQADEHLNFVVHNFTNASCLSQSPMTTIDAGRNVIDSAYCSDGWSSVDWNFDTSVYGEFLPFWPVN
jgi:hypothetical protein